MAKASGLGQRFYIGNFTSPASTFAFDLSGDIAAMNSCHGGPALVQVPALNSLAMERIGGRRDGGMQVTSYFNPAATLQAHAAWSTLPTTDLLAMYLTSTVVGDPAAAVWGPYVDYNGKRAADGGMLWDVPLLGDGFGLEWCQILKARGTDASAANGTSIDFGSVSTLFGASVYILVFSLATGTMTPEIQDSADNITFVAIAGMTMSAVSTAAANHAQRVQSTTAQTIRRYVRIASTGTFTNANWAAVFIRHLTSTL